MKVEKVGKIGGWKPGRLFTVIRQSFNRIYKTRFSIYPCFLPSAYTSFFLTVHQYFRMSQKFVPLISCTVTFDQNFLFLHEISRRCLFLYQVHVFRISVTGTPFLFCYQNSVAVAAWSGIQRVDPQMIHSEHFYYLVRMIQFNPQTIFFSV